MFTTLTSPINSPSLINLENDDLYNAIKERDQPSPFTSDLFMQQFLLNQIVLAASNSLNANQTILTNNRELIMASSQQISLMPAVDTNFYCYNNDVTSINEEEEVELDEEEEEDEYLVADTNKTQTNDNLNRHKLLTKQKLLNESSLINHLDLNRYSIYSTNNKQLMSQQQPICVNNCLAVDCNLASMSCCLSSSSSTSSLSSSSSSTSSSTNTKKTNIKHNLTTNIDKLDSVARNKHLFNKKLILNACGTRRQQSKSSSSISSFLASSKKHLSSSNDCLSSDEGYFGSFSDTSLGATTKLNDNEPQLKHQEQLLLLQFLLQNHNLQMPPIEPKLEEDTNGNENETVVIPYLNIFNTKEEEERFENPLVNNEDTDNEFNLCSIRFEPNTPKICLQCLNANQNNETELSFIWNSPNAVLCSSCCFDEDLNTLHSLFNQISLRRMEQAEADEIEMRSLNWRRLLEQRARVNRMRKELSEEDLIDCMAYLNEIEMNLDYFQADDHSFKFDLMFDDGLLKFRTNRMAFNLRKYHHEIEMEQKRRQLQNNKLKTKFLTKSSNQMMNMFANVHVDAIPEFIPVPVANTPQETDHEYTYMDLIDANDELELENEEIFNNGDYDLTYCEQVINDENETDFYDKLCKNDENDYTLIETHAKNSDASSSPSSTTTTISEQANQLANDPLSVTDVENAPVEEYEYYYENEEDYELYEDQLLIDSLSEQEAITLLRNESEMYALQMAQASKSGILSNQNTKSNQTSTKSSRKSKNRFNSGGNTATSNSQPLEIESDTKLTEQSSQQTSVTEDIFENVFNYDETHELIDEYETDFELNPELLMYESITSNTGQISVSLRNSLLKLRHTRRHLAKLIESESKNNAPASSSPAASSHLIKQMSSVSRKPCVYMLNEGRCMRADCRFAHDLKTITCKYWLDGECLKGENCEFLHDHMPEETHKLSSSYKNKKDKNIAVIVKQDFKLDTEEFPALGGSAKPSKLALSPKKDEKLINLVNKQPLKTAASVLLSKLSSNTSKTAAKSAAVNIVPNKAIATSNQTTASKKKASSNVSLSSSSSSSCSSICMNKNAPVAKAQANSKSNRKSRDSKTKSIISTVIKPEPAPLVTQSNKSVKNSCGSSSSSSSCSISSRGNSTNRKK